VSTLYIIATPIGNLEDITVRALRLLGQVKLIAAEDTRTTRHLLDTYNIKSTLTSYYEHNKLTKLDYLLNCLKDGDVALVSEAGMPGLSDTGYELINAAIERGIPVVPIPGASAVVTALVASGLPTDQFLYLGFLPRRKGDRHRLLESVASEPRSIIAFEAPHRLQDTLADAVAALGDRRAAICRELTKLHEEIFRGTLSEAMNHFRQPRGEFTLVIAGKKQEEPVVDRDVELLLLKLRKQGATVKETVTQLSKTTGIPKNKLYQAWLRLQKGD
jgi:16S rRNA (cytidine1402-2'-O)-methyltransferase